MYKAMLMYCLKCRKRTESENPQVRNTKRKIKLLQKFGVCNSKKSRFIKKKKQKGY